MSESVEPAPPHPRGLRVFFACMPPPGVASQICQTASDLAVPGKPVPQADLHLTLAFLGAQPPARVNRLISEAGLMDAQGATLQLDRVGYFSGPRIAWLGANRVPPALDALAARIRALCQACEIELDARSWRPHVSVARRATPPAVEVLAQAIGWRLDSFDLIESRPGQQGSVYRSLARWPLRPLASEDALRV